METKWDGTCVDEYCGNRIKMILGWIDIVGHLEWVETWWDGSDPTG